MLLSRPNTLSEMQQQELEAVKSTTKDIRVYRRTKVILYRNAGYTPDESEEHTDYSEREQRYGVRRYREEGVAGLGDHPRSGRPRIESECSSDEHSVKQDVGQELDQEADQDVEPQNEEEPEKRLSNLDEWSRVTLEGMQRYHPKRYVRERAQMLLLHDNGYSAAEIADILGGYGNTVGHVVANYVRDKLAGLSRKPGSGRLSKLGSEQWGQFAEWVRNGPKSLGDRFVKWTTRSLCKYLFKRFNIRFSREWIRQKWHHFLVYSWTQGKKVYAYPDNDERNTERKVFAYKMLAYLEQASKGEIILLFEDESILTLFGEVGYSWSPGGKTQEVPSAGRKGRVVVFGAVAP